MQQARNLILGLTALGTLATTNTAGAHDTRERHTHQAATYVASNIAFREAHPLRVFVKLSDSDEAWRPNRRGAAQGNLEGKNRIKQKMDYYLPDYVRFVRSAQEADLVLRVNRTDYQLNFRVIDVDQKDKKYKKSRRYAPGRCGIHHRAFYTKIKEKGEAYASYQIKANLKGVDRNRDHVTLRSAENFTYGKNLQATTNCGMRPTQNMPNSDVAELFSRSSKGYRSHVAQKIKREAMSDLSRKLVHRIRGYADQYYHELAHDLAGPYSRSRDWYGLRFIFQENPYG